eukprot:Em0001g267a
MMHAGIELRMPFMLSSSETQVLCVHTGTGLHIRWVWPKQLQQLEDITSYAHIPGCSTLNAVTALSNPNGLLIHTCGPSSPLILNTNSSSMSLQWNAPLQPDYVITAYTLHHRVPSLKSQSEMWAPPSTVGAWLHSAGTCSFVVLLTRPQSSSIPTTPAAFSSTNSVMTDFLGVKLHGGLPWLIFDVGSGPAVVGSNSTRTFNDSQWHTGYMVLFEQASNTFYVTVDTVHAAAITVTIVPLLTMKVYFEGFPSTSSRYGIATPYSMSPDGFDAVSVQNVGSTYIIVSWDLPTDSNGILINFSLYCNGALAGVLPLTVISYNTTGLLPFTLYMYITLSVGQVLQSRPQALHSSWNVALGVISVAASLPRRLVWLHYPAVPRGLSRKLHRPWKGPFKVVERFGNSTYKIKGPRSTNHQVVHFDRLKPCPPNIRLDQGTKGKLPRDNHDETVRPIQRQSLGSNLQLLDDGDDVIPPLPPEVDGPAPVPAARPADIVPRPPPAPAPIPRPEAPRRYPTRERKQTDFFGPYLAH